MWIVYLLCAVMIAAVVLGFEYENWKRYRRSSRGICNHDAQLREFVYRTELPAEQVRGLLVQEFRVPFVKYRFDAARNLITFFSDVYNGSPDVTYRVDMTEQGSGALIRVIQVDHLYDNKVYATMQNDFWSQLAQAEPVPFTDRRNGGI